MSNTPIEQGKQGDVIDATMEYVSALEADIAALRKENETLRTRAEQAETERDEWRQRGGSAAIRGAAISEDRDYMARIYGPTREKNNELERMVGELSDKLRQAEAKAVLADDDALSQPGRHLDLEHAQHVIAGLMSDPKVQEWLREMAEK